MKIGDLGVQGKWHFDCNFFSLMMGVSDGGSVKIKCKTCIFIFMLFKFLIYFVCSCGLCDYFSVCRCPFDSMEKHLQSTLSNSDNKPS